MDANTETLTVKGHFDACQKIEALIDDSNALVSKMQRELQAARETLECLTGFQHPKLEMQIPGRIREGDENYNKTSCPLVVIDRQVKRINAVLGDRA